MLKNESRDHVKSLLECSWEELEVLEQDGRNLFPATIWRRNGRKIEEIPVLLRIPREPDLRKARRDARRQIVDEGLDPELDSDLLSNAEIIHTLSICMMDPQTPNIPWEPYPEALEEKYDRNVLMHVWGQIEELRRIVDPKPDTIPDSEFLALVAAISQSRTVLPLVVYGQDAQSGFITTMASRLSSSPEFKSLLDSSEDSTVEGSPVRS